MEPGERLPLSPNIKPQGWPPAKVDASEAIRVFKYQDCAVDLVWLPFSWSFRVGSETRNVEVELMLLASSLHKCSP